MKFVSSGKSITEFNKDISEVHVSLDIAGGGKRGRISIAEMKALPNDNPAIALIFAESSFSASTWLSTLNQQQVKPKP